MLRSVDDRLRRGVGLARAMNATHRCGEVCITLFFNAVCILWVHDTRRLRFFGRASSGLLYWREGEKKELSTRTSYPPTVNSEPPRMPNSPILHVSLIFRRLPPSDRILPPLPPPSHQPTFSRTYKHLGCFKDKGDDRILGKRIYDSDNQSTDVRTNVNHHEEMCCASFYT